MTTGFGRIVNVASIAGLRGADPRVPVLVAHLAAGGGRPEHLPRGYYVEPTVFGNVDNSSTIAQEEIFGPVLTVIPADDEDHAVELANDTIYGLNASVFTDDLERAAERSAAAGGAV